MWKNYFIRRLALRNGRGFSRLLRNWLDTGDFRDEGNADFLAAVLDKAIEMRGMEAPIVKGASFIESSKARYRAEAILDVPQHKIMSIFRGMGNLDRMLELAFVQKKEGPIRIGLNLGWVGYDNIDLIRSEFDITFGNGEEDFLWCYDEARAKGKGGTICANVAGVFAKAFKRMEAGTIKDIVAPGFLARKEKPDMARIDDVIRDARWRIAA